MRSIRFVSRALCTGVAICLAALAAPPAAAHHSFAVFFDSQRTVTVSGVVEEFRFVNPHGLIRLRVHTKDGKTEEWKFETNSPSILRRRGWGPDSLKVGETIRVEGWPARDNTHWARLKRAWRANGTPIGQPLEPES